MEALKLAIPQHYTETQIEKAKDLALSASNTDLAEIITGERKPYSQYGSTLRKRIREMDSWKRARLILATMEPEAINQEAHAKETETLAAPIATKDPIQAWADEYNGETGQLELDVKSMQRLESQGLGQRRIAYELLLKGIPRQVLASGRWFTAVSDGPALHRACEDIAQTGKPVPSL